MTTLSSPLCITFRELTPNERLIQTAQHWAEDMQLCAPLELVVCPHRDGYQARLHARDSRLAVSDSDSDVFLAVHSVFARWNALVIELDQYALASRNRGQR